MKSQRITEVIRIQDSSFRDLCLSVETFKSIYLIVSLDLKGGPTNRLTLPCLEATTFAKDHISHIYKMLLTGLTEENFHVKERWEVELYIITEDKVWERLFADCLKGICKNLIERKYCQHLWRPETDQTTLSYFVGLSSTTGLWLKNKRTGKRN